MYCTTPAATVCECVSVGCEETLVTAGRPNGRGAGGGGAGVSPDVLENYDEAKIVQ